jgi:pilus assembly protein CpaC
MSGSLNRVKRRSLGFIGEAGWLAGRCSRLIRGSGRVVGFAGTALFAGALAVTPSHAQSSERLGGFQVESAAARHVTVTLNKSQTLRFRSAFSSAVVGAPDILDALPMTETTLYLQGKKIGTTNVSVFDLSMRLISIIDVEVAADAGNLQNKVRSATGARGLRVEATNGQVVLSGEVADAVTADRAVQVAKSLSPDPEHPLAVINGLSVKDPQQVMLKVRMLEVGRTAARALGVNWFLGSQNGTRGLTTGTGAPGANPTVRPGTITTPGGTVDGNGLPILGSGVPIFQAVGTLAGLSGSPFGVALASVVNNGTTIDALISALETKGLVRNLAEPDLVALSGDQANFLAGGEVPIPSIQAGGGVGGFAPITVVYKEFGVKLTFVPTVLKNGVINLRLMPEVSEVDFSLGLTVAGTTVPGFDTRRAQTTIELRDGQSFAIAGMLQTNNRRDISQLPWIGSVPVLGTLFSSKSFQQNESDLVVIVTPHLVAPAVPGQQLAGPTDQHLPSNDVDFFLFGQMELKKKYTDYVTRGGDLQGPYGHIVGGSK